MADAESCAATVSQDGQKHTFNELVPDGAYHISCGSSLESHLEVDLHGATLSWGVVMELGKKLETFYLPLRKGETRGFSVGVLVSEVSHRKTIAQGRLGLPNSNIVAPATSSKEPVDETLDMF